MIVTYNHLFPGKEIENSLPVIHKCDLFREMDDRDITTLITCFRLAQKNYRPHDVIVDSGDDQNSIGLVVDGEIQVQSVDYSGNRLIHGIFGPADLFGEVSAFAGSGRWLNTVVARTACRIIFIPVARISQPCEDSCFAHQTMIKNMLTIVANRALGMNRRINYLKLKHIRSKLAAFLFDQYRRSESLTFMLPFNRESMADYLNVSRPSMSRELGKMKTEGIIDFYRYAFTIKDLVKLRQLH